jgi:hypothetical protein|tara:strand:- start:6797 stop:7186 length:390 start_codon:yes stop_codon:yes gene_type:complete
MEKIRYVLRNDEAVDSCIDKLYALGANEDSPYEVTIQKYKSKRSSEQNNRYWLLLRTFSKETGHTVDELHAILATELLGIDTLESDVTGKTYELPYSTSKMKVDDFGEYMERVEQFMAEYGVTVPRQAY